MNVFKKFCYFIKKQAFYIVLLLCLCAVAITAVYTAKRNTAATKHTQKQVAQNQYKVNENNTNTNMPNADLVKEDQTKKQQSNKDTSKNTSKQVSNVTAVKFTNPIKNGVVTRTYKETPFKIETLNAFCTMKGISVKADKGTKVFSAAEGKVTNVGESDDNLIGYYVEITHSNGMKTVYSNLDKNVLVKKNDVVKQGQQIGVTGNTAVSLKNDKIAQDLGFQILNSKNEQVNPTKYVSFK